MSLWDIATADAARIIQSVSGGFARPATFTDPAGNSATINANCQDISQSIDPDTGIMVSGRYATVVLSLAALHATGLGTPIGIASQSTKPWLVSFAGADGIAKTFKVFQTSPDDNGLFTCKLELYQQ